MSDAVEKRPSAARAVGLLLCDDVRTEDNNKRLFVGVYSESIRFSANPAMVVVRPVVTLQSTEIGEHWLRVRFHWPGYEVAFEDGSMPELDAKFKFEAAGAYIHVPLPPLMIQVTASGRFVMEWSNEDGEWLEVGSITLVVNEEMDTAAAP